MTIQLPWYCWHKKAWSNALKLAESCHVTHVINFWFLCLWEFPKANVLQINLHFPCLLAIHHAIQLDQSPVGKIPASFARKQFAQKFACHSFIVCTHFEWYIYENYFVCCTCVWALQHYLIYRCMSGTYNTTKLQSSYTCLPCCCF